MFFGEIAISAWGAKLLQHNPVLGAKAVTREAKATLNTEPEQGQHMPRPGPILDGAGREAWAGEGTPQTPKLGSNPTPATIFDGQNTQAVGPEPTKPTE